MSTLALVTMILVQVLVTAVAALFMIKVIKSKNRP